MSVDYFYLKHAIRDVCNLKDTPITPRVHLKLSNFTHHRRAETKSRFRFKRKHEEYIFLDEVLKIKWDMYSAILGKSGD